VCRRLQRRAPHLAKIICCWNLAADAEKQNALETQLGANAAVVTSMSAAEQKILSALALPCETGAENGVALQERATIERLRELGLAAGKGPEFERLAATVAERLGASIVLVALVEEGCANGTPLCSAQADSEHPLDLSQLVCAEVITADGTVVVEDVAEDPRFARNAELLEKGIRFFAAAPLRAPSGSLIGALCVLDGKKRSLEKSEKIELEAIADELVVAAERTA
jgi:GAF domain-containing protein